MNRKETTRFLSDLLVKERLTGRGKYYASEVSLDYGTKDIKRVDFIQFEPQGVINVSEIEKGIFTSYEVKSCKADFNSGFGRNFVTEKNYFVMPMSLYKEVATEIRHPIGVMCPVPATRDIHEEFENPTPLDALGVVWDMKIIRPAYQIGRKRSMTELLFCLLRSGH